MTKLIIGLFVIVLFVIFFILHFTILHELRDIADDVNETYNCFEDEMILLADTLQVYHELLNDYQIPMIQIPREQQQQSSSDW